MRPLSTLCASLCLAGLDAAQAEVSFAIDQPQSNFNWSGTSTLGNIVGNPSTAFQVAGSTGMRLYPLGGDPLDQADFAGSGDAAVVPDLHGKINNVLPFLPPLALIDILNLHLSFGAPAFSVATNGTFSAQVAVTALSGTLNVTPLIGSPSSIDLSGLMSTPQAQNGTLTHSGTALTLSMPVNSMFPFSDPNTGASGSITIVGTLRATWSAPAAQVYCTAKVNSLSCTPAIAASGTASYTDPAPFTISAANELNQKAGLLYYGFAAASTPFQGGVKCVASPTVRTVIQNSGGGSGAPDCSGAYAFDFNAHVQSLANPLLTPGEEVFAQYWSRDPGSASTTNLTDAVRFTIAP
jgi:hypothetical protein